MKFKKFSVSFVILICLLKISTCQLFEQFNDELSALEKKSTSLFDEQEDNLKPKDSILTDAKDEKNTNPNAVPSLFGSIEEDLLKPIAAAKPEQVKKQTVIQKDSKIINKKNNNNNKNIKNNAGPIKNVANQAQKPSAESHKNNNLGKKFI